MFFTAKTVHAMPRRSGGAPKLVLGGCARKQALSNIVRYLCTCVDSSQ